MVLRKGWWEVGYVYVYEMGVGTLLLYEMGGWVRGG